MSLLCYDYESGTKHGRGLFANELVFVHIMGH